MRVALLVFALALAPVTQQASLSGDVSDSTGGLVPGASVRLSSATVPPRVVDTNAAGRFKFDDVASGEYDLTVTRPGFKTARGRVQVTQNGVNARVRLQLGSLTETVNVKTPNAPATVTAGVAAPATISRGPYASAIDTGESIEIGVAGPAAAAPLRIGGDITEPKKIRDVKPAYPDDAIAAGVAGTVVMEAVIANDGTVQEARVVRSVPMLDQAALGAVMQWRYTPTKLNGQPVNVLMTVSITFGR